MWPIDLTLSDPQWYLKKQRKTSLGANKNRPGRSYGRKATTEGVQGVMPSGPEQGPMALPGVPVQK